MAGKSGRFAGKFGRFAGKSGRFGGASSRRLEEPGQQKWAFNLIDGACRPIYTLMVSLSASAMDAFEKQYLRLQGRVIREWRKQQCMTQQALADAAHISRTEAQYIERAKRNPKVGTVKRICKALNHSYIELVARAEHLQTTGETARQSPPSKNAQGQRV